ncbi:MAG: biotin transporter BioY [Deltaproteobacteria bacterium CG11_big_fil_rev_8_21_14_0_20_45_16]|nr:MAG: biotin transporter BioY [Deltaproteobacteria bacterium CG11_big_fil_rev_8_21_14_0_20_45_16]
MRTGLFGDIRINSRLLQASLAATQIIVFSLLTAVSSKFSVELIFSPVPISLQSLVVISAGLFLGPWKGAASQVVLIAWGLAGFPVFARALPGIVVLLGPTGGFIIGFVFCAFLVGWMAQNIFPQGWIKEYALILLASMFIFLPGVLWLKVWTGTSIQQTLKLGFLPFLPGDIVKCGMALLAYRFYRRSSRNV